ncbi:MAG: Hint domain-containing protein [Pseudomonadota bacterium]
MTTHKPASPCFTPGTLIATARGAVPVETITEGDRVLTADNGLQPVAWVGNRTLNLAEIRLQEELTPILIKAGALADGRPERDMIVSPKHRFLVTWVNAKGGKDEVLVSADKLIDHRGVKPVNVLGVTYLHLLFENHQVILADGAWAESFRPDPKTWQGIGNGQRIEIEEIFAEARNGGLEKLANPARAIDERPLWKQRMRLGARR